MIKAIIFDLDDTLIMTSQAKYAAIRFAGRKFYGLELSDEVIKSHWGKPFEVFMHDLFGAVDSTDRIIENYYGVRNDFPSQAYEGSKDMLARLRNNYKLGMVTASTRHMTLEDLAIAGFDELMFDYIQTSEDTKYHKPDPKVFRPIQKKLKRENIQTQEILYVGDSASDWEAAQGAGVCFIGMANRTTTSQKFEKLGAKWVTSFEELESSL